MVTAICLPLSFCRMRSKNKKAPISVPLLVEMRAFGGPISCPFVFKFEYHVNSNYSDLSTVFCKN
ncbi:hypothetical protein EUA41_04905 [Bacillus velezensis]|nr:hypothetical protein EUA41_04905 [Bacillus velezensis]